MNRAAIALCLAGAAIAAAQVREVKYQGTDEDFANPERGFFVQRSYRDRRGALRVEDLRAARGKQLSLVRMLYSLREFREAPLPDDVLASLGADFGRAREAGMKVIPRFSYSSAIGQPDASLERILAHIGQLKPVLRANADVIALFEAGFAGAWGEWHSSTNGLFDAGPGVRYHQVNEKTRAILDALMDALPADRMIVVRCPRFKTVIFGEQPLSTEDGFSGTPKARTGALNDCLDLAPHGVPLPPARCTHSGGCEGGRPPCDELPGDQRGLVPDAHVTRLSIDPRRWMPGVVTEAAVEIDHIGRLDLTRAVARDALAFGNKIRAHQRSGNPAPSGGPPSGLAATEDLRCVSG